MENDLLWITDAVYIDGYEIAITFNDGCSKTVDLKEQLYGEIFEPLKDKEKFKQFRLSDWSVEWQNGADFAPEFLYSL